MTLISPPVRDVLRRAVDALAPTPTNELYLKLGQFPVAKDLDHFDHGVWVSLRFRSGEELADALHRGDPTVMVFALQLLSPFDRLGAAQLACELVAVPTGARTGTLDPRAIRSARATLDEAALDLPLEKLVELGVAGHMDRAAPRIVKHPELRTVEERRALLRRLDREQSTPFTTGARMSLTEALVEAGDEETIGALVEVWRSGKALEADNAYMLLWNKGDKGALFAIASHTEAILHDSASPPARRSQAVGALVRTGDADRVVGTLAPRFFRADALEAPEGAELAEWALSVLKDAVEDGAIPKTHRGLIQAVLPLVGTEALGARAKELLRAMSQATVKSVKSDSAKSAKPAARKAAAGRTAPATARRIDYPRRYRAGEHREVWDELNALGAGVRDPAVAAEAHEVALEAMRRMRQSLEEIVAVLRRGNYAFAAKEPLPNAAADAAKDLEAIEKLAGPLPVALRAFYEVFDGVTLAQDREAPTDDPGLFTMGLLDELGQYDCLVVVPLGEMAADLRAQVAKNKALLPELREPLRAYLSPDVFFKGFGEDEYADEHPARMPIPDERMDGRVEMMDGTPFFVDWLRAYVGKGGFLRLKEPNDRDDIALLTAGVVPF